MVLSHLIDALTSLVFPALCLHCKERLVKTPPPLCSSCSELLHLLPLQERCRRCFYPVEKGPCERCITRPLPFRRVVSTFEYLGPAASFLRAFKHGGREEFAKDLAAFMTIQFLRSEIPLPDLILPVPQSLAHRLSRGYNQSLLLAQELVKLLERPLIDPLKRRAGDFSQTGLSKERRLELEAEAFSWKTKCDIADKSILVVDDVMTTGSTLRAVGHLLEEGCPASLYAITCCTA